MCGIGKKTEGMKFEVHISESRVGFSNCSYLKKAALECPSYLKSFIGHVAVAGRVELHLQTQLSLPSSRIPLCSSEQSLSAPRSNFPCSRPLTFDRHSACMIRDSPGWINVLVQSLASFLSPSSRTPPRTIDRSPPSCQTDTSTPLCARAKHGRIPTDLLVHHLHLLLLVLPRASTTVWLRSHPTPQASQLLTSAYQAQ